jgi:hypothetical protein
VVPDAALECDAVLSIGVGTDVSFDRHLAERGARVLQFDHTVNELPATHPNFSFHQKGWGPITAGDLLDFKTIAAKLEPIAAQRALLKFDVEGAEYDALDAVHEDSLKPFAVIVCELHNLSRLVDAAFFDQMHRVLAKLTLYHAVVHLHPNNYAPVVLVEGVPLPDVLEVSFLRRDLDVFPGLSSEPIPGPLDRPNHPLLPDLCMTAFAAVSPAPVAGSAREETLQHHP